MKDRASLTPLWFFGARPYSRRSSRDPCGPVNNSRGASLKSEFGGAEGDRTPDLMNAIHALSQLSYGPILITAHRAGISACHDRGERSVIQSGQGEDACSV